MIAFFVFFALMIVFIVGSVCISMYLYAWNWTDEHEYVTLNQHALIEGRSGKQPGGRFDREMGECVRRVAGISLGVVAVMVILVIAFLNMAL